MLPDGSCFCPIGTFIKLKAYFINANFHKVNN